VTKGPTGPSFAICPHPKAPNLSSLDPEEASRTMLRLALILDKGLRDRSRELRMLLREASLVNSFFWIKYVCGSGGGPYTKLSEEVHLDMLNFLQGPEAMAPGSRVQVVQPRGTYKSSAATHGFASWLIIRDPNVRIRIVNAVVDRAEVFLRIITTTFHANPVVWWLFKEFCIANLNAPQGAAKSNSKELTVPCRSVYYPEPTVKAGGATGSSEGDHHDWLFIDDPVGMDELDANHRANIDMEKKRNWFEVNSEALLVEPNVSHVRVACTFYSPDDPNQIPVKDARAMYGYQAHWFKPKPGGRWLIYYRKALEDGKPAFPSIYDAATLEWYAANRRWYYLTQLQNDIYDAGTVEFAKFDVERGRAFKAELTFPDGTVLRDWVLFRTEDPQLERTDRYTLLRDCDVLMSCDPAATEEGLAAKSCRTAVEVWARDRNDRKFCIWLKAGFVSVNQMYDWIFEGFRLFEGAIRGLVLETNAYQKILKRGIEEEQLRRGVFFTVYGQASTGGKEARIRSTLGNELAQGTITMCNRTWLEFCEEKDLFPGSRYFMDVLDAAEMAISKLQRPAVEEEQPQVSEIGRRRLELVNATTGY